jgi:hypothetical protein
MICQIRKQLTVVMCKMQIFAAMLMCAVGGGAILACGGSEADSGASSGSAKVAVDPTSPGPLMQPGQNCLRCHSPSGTAKRVPWTAGGTVYASKDAAANAGIAGVKVTLSDKAGKTVSLVTNEAGNFYTAEPFAAGGINIKLEKDGKVRTMPRPAPAGSCGACHSYPDPIGDGVSIAEGRVYLN